MRITCHIPLKLFATSYSDFGTGFVKKKRHASFPQGVSSLGCWMTLETMSPISQPSPTKIQPAFCQV